ncbi:Gfo/Idh/MocA family protein [Acidicapsa dinghuensis]|uniref:Gfo/Idh/MocA family protein n=1 Tax=Acidicapsa dinghuensis TaxID=2218256 RepID=A0ABW1EBS4_9BACT|nr:Gfo/Idh/MocA family oxidoreductase [Acidicapsa dinghuensis]
MSNQPFATTRRSFLVASGLTALASARAFGANDTLRVGVIGAGQRMDTLLNCAEKSGPHEIVAVADPYKPHREEVLKREPAAGAILHIDYREVLDNHSIDTVFIATPDHWHVRIAADALAAGKDVYLEKPVTHTIEEGETLRKAVRSSKQILQCGMQQRSWIHFRDAARMIRAGEIGRVLQVRTYWWQNYQRASAPGSARTGSFNMADLDWKQWLGSAPDQPFNEDRFYRWRWYWNFGGGAMTDLFTHWIDVVHMTLGSDSPSHVFMLGDKYHFQEWDCPDTVQAALRYPAPSAAEPATIAQPSPFDVVYEGMMASSIDDGGLEFRGTDATLKINRSGMSLFREGVHGDINPVLTERSTGDGTVTHMQNFFECVRSRKEPNAPVEAGISAAHASHLCNQAYHGNGQWSQ